jgi:hypothetical protein
VGLHCGPQLAVGLLFALGLLPACGKRGDPLPPLSRTPQPVTGLKLAQRGDRLEIVYVAPRATTGGIRLGILEVEVLRAEAAGELPRVGRRTQRRVAPGETLAETSPLPAVGTTVRVAARARDGGHVSGLTPVASLTVQPAPPAPHDLVAELEGESVHLSWAGTIPSPPPTPPPSPAPSPTPSSAALAPAPTARPSALVSPPGGPSPSPPGLLAPSPSPSPSPTPRPPSRGFWIYRRREPAGGYGGPLQSEPLTVKAFEDRSVALGQRWCYAVATVVSTEPVVESVRSNEACVSVRDIVPPASPTGVAALGGPDGVEVSWSPSSETDLASYRVYRAPAEGGPRQRLGEVTPPETALRDATAAPGARYVYTVTAVDGAGNESPVSAAAPGGRP